MAAVGNLLILRLSLRAVPKEVDAQTLRAEEDNRFYGLAGRPVSEERPASRTRSIRSCLIDQPEHTVCVPIATIPALVEDDVVRVFGDEEHAMQSIRDTR